MFDYTTLVTLGFALIFAGFMIAFAAAFFLFFRGIHVRGKARGGGLVMIGPIPIIFGTDKETVKILLILSVVLMVLVLIVMVLPRVISR